MIVQRKPKDKIRSMVDIIWYVEEPYLEEDKRKDIIVPTGHIHIVYNFNAPYFIDGENKKEQVPDIVLVGQFQEAVKIEYGDNVKQLGLAFRPSALYALFHRVSGLYTGAIIDCRQIEAMKNLHHAILKTVREQKDIEVMFDHIENYFEREYVMSEEMIFFEEMMRYLEEKKGLIDIILMADHFGYSVSALERAFKKQMGITPKAYANILRFRYAVLEDDPQILFYDQSHFIKNCKKYTSKIPADLSSAEEISLLHMLDINKV
jgi:AraC-like DNA-binding protein